MTDPVRLLYLLGWLILLILAWKNQSTNRPLSWFLIALTGVVLLTRWPNLLLHEPDIDTSTWLASTITLHTTNKPLWTWLLYTDGRPLTVAPLWLANALGMPKSYAGAELTGIFLWCVTCIGLAGLFRTLGWKSGQAFLIVLTLGAFVATTGRGDELAYNSELASAWLLALAVWSTVVLIKSPSYGKALLTGVLLGLLPYAKFQTAPMGVTIALFALVQLIRSSQWKITGVLIFGGLLPTFLMIGYFLSQGTVETFWNHYFLYYFYYSYTDEFSKIPAWQRFLPNRFLSITLTSAYMRWYAIALFLSVGVLSIHFLQKKKTYLDWLILCLILLTYYSILQSGNNFHHYSLYLLFTLPLAVGVWGIQAPVRFQQLALGILVLGAAVQLTWNLWNRAPYPAPEADGMAHQIADVIRTHSKPTDRLTIWGWADRLHVYTQRGMGHRYTYSIGIFYPSPMHDTRVKDFLSDLEENKPAVFVDVCGTPLSLFGGVSERHEATPEVAAYIARQYQLIRIIDGARIYQRKQ